MKAAIHAGVQVMLEEYGIEVGEVQDLVIAGGFGSFIDLASAARIGLFPSELLDRARAVGSDGLAGVMAVKRKSNRCSTWNIFA